MAQSIQNIISSIEEKFDDQFQDNMPEQLHQSQVIEQQNASNDIPNPEINIQSDHTHSNKVAQTINETSQPEEKNDKNSKPAQKKQSPIKQKQTKLKKQIQINDQDQEQENKYKNLSHKLETALKKISSSKNQFHTLNKNKTVSLLHRFEEHEKKKEKQLDEKRKLEQQRKYLGLKSKPDIDPKSRKMAEETSYKPIYERVERILEDKKKKSEQNQQDKKNKQEEEYQKFLDQYNKHTKINKGDCRDSDTYFQDMITWKSKLQKERQEKMKQKNEKEVEGFTFKPELNKRSMKIAGKTKRVPIQQRQIERPKTQYSYYDYKPKLNKKTSKT